MSAYRTYTRRLNIFEQMIHASYGKLVFLWLFLNLACTLLYFALSLSHPAHAPTLPDDLTIAERLFDSFYFSIVIATTLGFGDYVPLGFSKVLVMAQSTLALLIFTGIVGKLISQRQDETLRQVHRMTFEGVFYHIRHVLSIVRKDFDLIIQKAQADGVLEEQDWQNLATAYLQANSLIEEIPDLYNGRSYDLHSVDLNREKLLFEALHRTLARIHKLIETLDAAGIEWLEHQKSAKELRRLIDMVDAIMPLWNERSPYHEEAEFEDIRQLSVGLHRQLRERTRR